MVASLIRQLAEEAEGNQVRIGRFGA